MSVPSVPNIRFNPRSRNQYLQFYWSPPATGPVTSYLLSNASIPYSTILDASTFTAAVSPVTNGVDYSFTLAASNANGLGPAATFRTVQTGTGPGVPTAISAQAVGDSTVALVQWSTPVSTGGATLRRNLVTFVPLDSSGSEILNSTFVKAQTYAGDTARYVSPIGRFNYHVYVQALTDAGFSPFTAYYTLSNQPVFAPTSVPGLYTWLDAADTTSYSVNGSNAITSWKNKVTNLSYSSILASTPTKAVSTLNSKPTISFYRTAVTWNLGTPYTGSTLSAFIVFKLDTETADYTRIIGYSDSANTGDTQSADGISVYLDKNVNILGTWRNSVYSAVAPTYGSYLLATSVIVPGNLYFSLNGNNLAGVGGATTSNLNIDSLHIGWGGYSSGGDNFLLYTQFTGNIAEMVTFSNETSSSNRQKMEGYLAWKWGLEGSLPSNHPYKGAAPTS